LNKGLALTQWEELLGERSREAWAKVDEMWTSRLLPAAFNRYVDQAE
jgi:hypothetical protein